MALSRSQQQMAGTIYSIARSKGLNDARAREMVAASYAESGLNPSIRNKSSGATGLFQLLSSGYVNRANQLGGVTNPRANTLAIVGDYANYWKAHPNAAPGEAARDVERSGEGAGFYSAPLGLIGDKFGAVPAAGAAAPVAGAAGLGARPPAVDQGEQGALTQAKRESEIRQMAIQNLHDIAMGEHSPEDAIQRIGNFVTAIHSLPMPQAPQAAQLTDPMHPQNHPPDPGAAPTAGMPVEHGKVIGTPYQGTHAVAFNKAGGSDNWESENANDIAVPVGTPIYAVSNGTIGSQFGSLGTGGRFAGLRLHLVGAKNEWYYAHLSKFAPGIKPGTRVRAGELLGYSGEANGVAHLHIASKEGHPPT